MVALIWDMMGRNRARTDDIVKTIDESPNSHNQLVYVRKKTANLVSNRDYLWRMVWSAEKKGAFIIASLPEASQKRRTNKIGISRQTTAFHDTQSCVRIKTPLAYRVSPLENGEGSKVDLVLCPDAGGNTPRFLLRRNMASRLVKVTEIRVYVEEQRELDDYDEIDGYERGERHHITPRQQRLNNGLLLLCSLRPPPPRPLTPPPHPPPHNFLAQARYREKAHVPGRQEYEGFSAWYGEGGGCPA